MDQTALVADGPEHEVPLLAAGARARPGEAHALLLQALTTQADLLLRIARRHSLCVDDAHDAYQRAMEIFIRRADTLDPDRALNWLTTVVKHEAMAVRRNRLQLVGDDAVDPDRQEARNAPSPEEHVLDWEQTTRSAEALKRLKPQEARAMWLKAMGHSYQGICEQTGWSYTKVNRCLAEGRKSFLHRYAGIESGAECDRWAPLLSAIVDGEATKAQIAEARPHLRNCGSCRATMRELHAAAPSLAAVFPAGGLILADGAIRGESGLLLRLYEALATAIHDRAATGAIKLQAAVDAASTGKVAAVAASAAAVAGGGAVAVEHAVQRTDSRPARTATKRTSAAQTPPSSAASVASGRTTTPTRQSTAAPKPRRTGAGETRRSQVSKEFSPPKSSAVSREFGTPSASAASSAAHTSAPPARPVARRPPTIRNGSEFDP